MSTKETSNSDNTENDIPGDFTTRLIEERERLGLSVPQFAVLVGVSKQDQEDIESEKKTVSVEYMQAVGRIGGDPVYISTGTESKRRTGDRFTYPLSIFDDFQMNFNDSLVLFRKSIDAVDAFLGEGTSSKSPELVAALLNISAAHVIANLMPGPGGVESHGDRIADAIEGLGANIQDAIEKLSTEVE